MRCELIAGARKVKTRLIAMIPKTQRTSTASRLPTTKVAPKRPKIAPEAPAVAVPSGESR